VTEADKPIVWLHGEIKTPPFSQQARVEAGFLLRGLQRGEVVAMPHSRPMPAIGRQCYELRIVDRGKIRRMIYHVDEDAAPS
jgi:phage-related protein